MMQPSAQMDYAKQWHGPQERHMNMKWILACLLFSGVLACGAGNQHGVSTDPNPATGFVLENPIPPSTAKPCDKPGITLACDADGRPFGYALLGMQLPPIDSHFLDGSPFNSKMIDRWTIIDVWGIWCGDCMADAPFAAELSEAISKMPDLAFLSIHVPASAIRATEDDMFGKYGSVDAYFKHKGYSYPTIVDTDASLRAALKISWTPSYLLVSPDGYVRGFRTDLSVTGEDAVARFLNQIKAVQKDVSATLNAPQLSSLSIGPQGAMNLTQETIFTAPAMEAAFPNLTVVADRGTVRSETYPVYHIKQAEGEAAADTTLYTVTPTWTHGYVKSVSTRAPTVMGPNGLRINVSRIANLNSTDRDRCYAGDDTYDRQILCPDSVENPRFIAVYGPVAAPDGETQVKNDENQGDYILIEMKFMPDIPIDAR
jgi:thiol-disulfide isomerase/thioredoxin